MCQISGQGKGRWPLSHVSYGLTGPHGLPGIGCYFGHAGQKHKISFTRIDDYKLVITAEVSGKLDPAIDGRQDFGTLGRQQQLTFKLAAKAIVVAKAAVDCALQGVIQPAFSS